MAFAMPLSKLVLFNVRFEVLIVVNVGCYVIHCDRELPLFQRNMPASSGYIALKMGAAGSLQILTHVSQAIWHDISKDGNLQMQCKLHHHHNVAIME
jgi:hypothetical protein